MVNSIVTLLCQMAYLIVSFICRTIFTNSLGAEYLGISGLFSNILTILSFAELGIGNALVYRMYTPLEKNDREKMIEYMRLYKKIYHLIIGVILCRTTSYSFYSINGCCTERKRECESIIYLIFRADTSNIYTCL